MLQTVWSIFNHFHVIGPKATEFGEITQNEAYYAIQGHLFCYQSKVHMRLSISISD